MSHYPTDEPDDFPFPWKDDQVDANGEPIVCGCCSTPSTEMAIDPGSMLCLYCQPCGWCGRQGTGCDSQYRSAGCDPQEYPDRPRRDVNEVMAELSANYRDSLARRQQER